MKLPIAIIGGVLVGVLAAFGVAVVPGSLLENIVVASGVAAVFSAAEPPLGMTARALLVIAGGGFVGLFAWFSLMVLLGSRGLTIGKEPGASIADAPVVPTVRRADAHPDAPPRPPLLATRDLGPPFAETSLPAPEPTPLFKPMGMTTPERVTVLELARMPDPDPDPEPKPQPQPQPLPISEVAAATQNLDEAIVAEAKPEPEPTPVLQSVPIAAAKPMLVERPLPRDLDQPLSAFDPGAVPARPLPPPISLPPLRRPAAPPVFKAGERFEVFELTPPVRPVLPPRAASMASPPITKPAPATARAAAEPITRPETDASIHALLERLERGVLRKGLAERVETSAPERGLEDALVTLRNLARRA